MKHIHNYELFVEARLSDIVNIIGTGITFDNSKSFNDNFLRYKTISKRINNKKIRLNIMWNHTLKHDLIKRIEERTNLHNIDELNSLLDNGLDELYLYNLNYIKDKNRYSLWFSEYNFSIIVDIRANEFLINVITIVPGMITHNVKNIIELKSTI